MALRRMPEPENIFGQPKNNRGFRQFLLRGMEKVMLESDGFSFLKNAVAILGKRENCCSAHFFGFKNVENCLLL